MKSLTNLFLMLFLVASCDIFQNEQDLGFSDPRCDGDFLVVAEQMPILIGGLAELQRKVVYPEEAREQGIEGRVTVQFLVTEQGNVICPRVVRGIGGGCNEAAVEAVKKAKFEPGMQRGEPVRIQYSLPIVFRLES